MESYTKAGPIIREALDDLSGAVESLNTCAYPALLVLRAHVDTGFTMSIEVSDAMEVTVTYSTSFRRPRGKSSGAEWERLLGPEWFLYVGQEDVS